MSDLKATTSLIFVQVFSRLSTFAINQASLRYLSPALLGASTQLELLSTTILTFARDSLRVALAREGYDPDLQGVVNAAHLPLLLGIPLSFAFKALYEYMGLPEVPGMGEAVNWICAASILEMLAEPAFALVQVKGEYGIRAQAETTATIARCVVTFASVVYTERAGLEAGVLPFAYGQVAYAVVLLLMYLIRIGPLVRAAKIAWLPTPVRPSPKSTKSKPTTTDTYFLNLVSNQLIYLAFTLSAQTIVKQLLGEGDHVVMAMLCTLEDQGSYDLAHNYGSLVARMAFQPIEEGCRGLFGRLCAGAEDEAKTVTSEKPRDKNEGAAKAMQKNLSQALGTLQLVLKLYGLFTVAVCALGPTLAPLALRVIAGAKWSDSSASTDGVGNSAGAVLATYCYLLPFMAFNGILEAFVSAVATPAQLYQQSVVMSVFTGAFGAASFLFLGVMKLGAHGLIYAQCVAMALRILWSWWFSAGWFRSKDMRLNYREVLPNSASVGFGAMAATTMRLEFDFPFVELVPKAVAERVDMEVLRALITKGSLAVLSLVTLGWTEQAFLAEQWELVAPTAKGGMVESKKKQ